jgi:hypothetical protein
MAGELDGYVTAQVPLLFSRPIGRFKKPPPMAVVVYCNLPHQDGAALSGASLFLSSRATFLDYLFLPSPS